MVVTLLGLLQESDLDGVLDKLRDGTLLEGTQRGHEADILGYFPHIDEAGGSATMLKN